MALKVSTGHAKHVHGIGSVVKAYRGGLIKVYGGAAAPATADAAVAGTLLYTISNNGQTVKAAQKIRFTPTPGTANAAEWNITLNGVKITFIDDATPTAAEICTGLYNKIRAAIGTTSYTTPAGKINIPEIYGKFTLTDNAGTLDIESSVAGVAFDYTATVSGAGAGTGSWATAVLVADAYGLEFEAAADITLGKLEKLASQTWSATVIAAGTPTYFRIIQDSDTGGLSTTEIRMQGSVSTVAGSDMVISHASVVVGETIEANSASFNIPLT